MDEVQERIVTIISTKNMTNAEFADAIGVQPSNISHVMSGRNKPSLDLVMKILKRFPELRSEWLISGKGSMTKEFNLFGFEEEAGSKKTRRATAVETDKATRGELVAKISQASAAKSAENEPQAAQKEEDEVVKAGGQKNEEPAQKSDPHKNTGKPIEKIVVFYADRSFREYIPEG